MAFVCKQTAVLVVRINNNAVEICSESLVRAIGVLVKYYS